MTRSLRLFAAWLAFLGIAFAAVWPVVATAMPSDPSRAMVDCPHTGLKMLDLSDQGKPSHDDPATKQPGNMQCALCASGADHALPVVACLCVADASIATSASFEAREQMRLPRNTCSIPPAHAPPFYS